MHIRICPPEPHSNWRRRNTKKYLRKLPMRKGFTSGWGDCCYRNREPLRRRSPERKENSSGKQKLIRKMRERNLSSEKWRGRNRTGRKRSRGFHGRRNWTQVLATRLWGWEWLWLRRDDLTRRWRRYGRPRLCSRQIRRLITI